MNKTKIEYLDYTWNPIAMRCTPVSEGCRNCWHLAMAKRLAKNPLCFEDQRKAYAGGKPSMQGKELTTPLRLRKTSRIGVQFMGDLFHGAVENKFISAVFNNMGLIESQKHTFLILTKRPRRILEWLKYHDDCFDTKKRLGGESYNVLDKNLWLGVSVEDKKTANERIPILLQIPAAKRFVSVEPMLNKIDLLTKGYLADHEWERGVPGGLNWVICGGETGPGARPLHPDWVKSLRDQCQAAGVPFFFKGWGEWLPALSTRSGLASRWSAKDNPQSKRFKMKGTLFSKDESLFDGRAFESYVHNDGCLMVRVGHKLSGHFLDGQEWKEFPK